MDAMRLITFTQGANPRCGLALSGTVGLDLLAADPTLPANWHALFGEMDRIRELGDRFGPRAEDAGDHPSLPLFRLAAARLLPPIVLPSKIVCVGLNYRDHAAEQNKPLPDLPMLFSKAPSCLQTHDGPIELTPDLTEVDAEAELAFVIGRRMSYIAALFRAYHADAGLFGPPFTPAQTAALKAGQRPSDL